MGKELVHGPHREAGDPSRDETRQSGLNDSENKATVPTWDAEHYNHPMRPASVGSLGLTIPHIKWQTRFSDDVAAN